VKWVKLDTDFADHPKLLGVSPVAQITWIRSICWSAKFLTDGFVPRSAFSTIGISTRVANSLVEAGLWDAVEDCDGENGIVVHNFCEWQVTSDESERRRSAVAERQRRARAKKASSKKPEPDPHGETPEAPRTPAPVVSNEPRTRLEVAADEFVDHHTAKAKPTNPEAYRRTVRASFTEEHGTRCQELTERFPDITGRELGRILLSEAAGEPSQVLQQVADRHDQEQPESIETMIDLGALRRTGPAQ